MLLPLPFTSPSKYGADIWETQFALLLMFSLSKSVYLIYSILCLHLIRQMFIQLLFFRTKNLTLKQCQQKMLSRLIGIGRGMREFLCTFPQDQCLVVSIFPNMGIVTLQKKTLQLLCDVGVFKLGIQSIPIRESLFPSLFKRNRKQRLSHNQLKLKQVNRTSKLKRKYKKEIFKFEWQCCLISIISQIIYQKFHKIQMNDDNQSQAFTQYDEEGDKIINPGTLSKEQQIYFEEARKKHRFNMTKPQKVGTTIFKGPAFIAKPDKIVFKDFEVGKTHILVLTLTNVSNAFNSFNVLPLPEKIRNYFQVLYTPKGKISPGITNQIKFKFFPQLNEDIESQFSILAETGQIDFPIICTSKKAIIRCSDPVVDFGKVIEGQVGQGKLVIKNEGSLPTQIIFKSEDGLQINKSHSSVKEMVEQLQFERVIQINGYCEKVINIKFRPADLGQFRFNLQLYTQNFLYSPPINVFFKSQCIRVPVKIEKPVYDFEICLLNHIYREKLTITNSGDLPMSFKVTQTPAIKKYFEFSPVIGYIQKESKIDIWVKFTADKDLSIYLAQFLNEQGFYVVPFKISIKEQFLPVTFSIKFKITSDKVTVRPPQLNFGSIYEGLSSKIKVSFQNESDLPQQVLLYPLKKNIYVQNEQSLFKILPKSQFTTYITYRSKLLDDYKRSNKEEGSIPCKIITGDIAVNEIKIDYSCETIKPILSISHNKIELPSLQIDEVCYTSTILKNNSNREIIYELFHPPFQVSGLKITPVVKTLSANQYVQVNIQYHSSMRNLGPFTLNDMKQNSKQVEEEPPQEEPKEQKKEGKKQKLSKQQQEALQAEQKRLEEEAKLKKQKEEEQRRQLQENFDSEKQLSKLGGTLISFQGTQHYKWLLPVYFKNKDYPDGSSQVNFLEVTTTATKKILISDHSVIDFGQIAVGGRQTRQLTITNQGETLELKKKQLPAFCCFSVLNSLNRQVESGQNFKAVIEFQPTENQIFQHNLIFYTSKSIVSCLLKGKGVRPDINITPESGLLEFGGVLLDQFSQKTFTIKNICNFEVTFILKDEGEGIKNSNSSRAISYLPTSGKIPPNDSIQVKVRFQPDRVSEKYYNKIKVFVPEQKTERYLFVTGSCYPRQAFVCDYKPSEMPTNEKVSQNAEYSLDWLRIKDEDIIYGPNNKQIILKFTKIKGKQGEEEEESCFKKKLTIGSCKLLDPKNEKPTNFQFILPKDDRFQCDNLKGAATPGTQTVATFTYKPEQPDPLIAKIPVLMGVGQWKDIKAELKISGGFIKPGVTDAVSFQVILRVYVNQI